MSLFLYAFPLAFLFLTLSDQWTPAGFVVGYIMSLAILLLSGHSSRNIRITRLPAQIFWLCVYSLRLVWDIFVSSIDVARRILNPRMPINPGELVISTQDKSTTIAALSAHAVTVTPGEMVADFRQTDLETSMVIHTLDVDATGKEIQHEQMHRLTLLNRIAGESNS